MTKIVVVQDVGLTQNQRESLRSLGDVQFFETVPESKQERLDRVKGAEIIYSEEAFMHENLYDINDCFLTFPFTAFLKDIDVEILKRNKVISASAKGGNKYAVSEWNITALLYIARQIKAIQQSAEKLSWSFLSSITGVRGLRVLVLGKGNIGSVTGELCAGLGMEVSYFTRGDDLKNCIAGKDVICKI